MLSGDTLLALNRLKAGDHIGFLYTDAEEHLAVLEAFVRLGLERGERVIVHTDSVTAAGLDASLGAAGLDAGPYVDRGQLAFRPLPEKEAFEAEGELKWLREAVERALHEGYTALRVVQETPRWQTEPPHGARLVEYEAGLNDFLPGRPCLVMSAYDRVQTAPTLLLESLHTHPVVIADGEVYDNAGLYYIEKSDLLGPGRPAAELRSRLDRLQAHYRAERARRESELKYRKLFDESLDGIALADVETGIVLDCNQAFLDLVERSREEVVGQPQRILHPPEDSPGPVSGTFEQHRSAAHGQVLEARVITKKGEIRLVEIRANLLELGGQFCLRGVFHDVTWRKEAEATLSWASAANAALAELAQALLSRSSLKDIAGLVLKQARRLTGSAYGFVGHIDAQDLVLASTTAEVWDTCEVADPRATFHNFAGLWGWVLQNRRPLLSNMPQRDVRSAGVPPGHLPVEQFLAVPAIVGDTLVGIVALANPGRDYTGRDLEVIERLAQLYALAIQRQRAEDVLRERTAELQARNEDLDAFAHTVAHDLKSPLTSVLGYAEILERYPALPEEPRTEYLHAIAQHSRTMDNIVQELLLLASVRQEEVQRGPLDMARIVGEVLRRMADMVAQFAGEVVVPAEWPEAVGYGPWIAEVWVNYISNALKYGGRPPRVELGAAVQPDGMVRFWVQDNGAGLASEEQVALFTPFTRLDKVRARGHGLGLSIVRRIVEKLEGRVGTDCPPGGGCVFWFTLPAA